MFVFVTICGRLVNLSDGFSHVQEEFSYYAFVNIGYEKKSTTSRNYIVYNYAVKQLCYMTYLYFLILIYYPFFAQYDLHPFTHNRCALAYWFSSVLTLYIDFIRIHEMHVVVNIG